MISWKLLYYSDLSRDLLYQILKIRQEVFIIEQDCHYLDADNYDQSAYHLMCFKNNNLIAYMRILDSGLIYKHKSFGRILVKKEYRSMGFGRELMKKAISYFSSNNECVVMSAQLYLIDFYKEFCFYESGEEYLEDSIPHIKMIRNA